MKLLAAILCCASVGDAQWIRATSTLAVAPDVHSVYSDSRFVYVESAGLSLHSFGRLEANQYDAPLGPRKLTFRIPRNPKPAAVPVNAPLGIIGVFVTGVPIYNPIGTASYQDQNIWHQDAVAASKLTAAPGEWPQVIGYALDGYPILRPSGLRSSYRLRQITKRTQLPDGTVLTPGQEGPDVGPEYPLGSFAEDYEYVAGSGDLDEFNGHATDGGYAYFATGTWPYLIGPKYYGEPSLDRPARIAVQHGKGVDLWTDRLQIEANQPVQLTLAFRSRFLEKIHEKPVHLIVVSKDFEVFNHIHPSPVPGDGLSVSHTFPKAGEYWIYADYTAPGEPPSVARFSLTVGGPAGKLPAIKPAGKLQIEANRDVTLSFPMQYTDLQPWLGAWAHIMIISRDGQDFIHAHPLDAASTVHTHEISGPSPSAIRTQTGVRTPGDYRLWLQYQRQGEIVTVPWDLKVVAGSAQPAETPAPQGIRITVSREGFSPARIEVPAGKPVRLAFTRLDAQNCGSAVVFPDLGLRKTLPVGKTVVVELPARPAGELRFACGMGMYKGAVVVR
jgi:plastocyanin